MAPDYQTKTDEELVRLTLLNQAVYLYLMRRYEQKLLRYIQRLSNMALADAEDILQEVFIKVFQNLNDFDRNLKFSSWIYRITHNEVVSHFRKLKSRGGEPMALDEEHAAWHNLCTEFGIDDQLDQADRRKNIEQVLDQLDHKYREVLFLRFMEDKSYEEIADILKKPMGTVATLINRAKQQFKKIFQYEPDKR